MTWRLEFNRHALHDLIQDMGREIVREVSPLEPGKRSRLWYHEDVFEVLSENTVRVMYMLVIIILFDMEIRV